MALNSIEEIIEDIRQGRMVILMDDEDRENEGDLIMAAEKVSPDDINFMARYGRGLICLTLTRERCERLKLPLMVSSTGDIHSTNFTVSIEAARGVTTGISAADRATTVQAAVAPGAGPDDIVMPGHIFPLMAQPGGVLARAGHTEAGCDLTRMAGLEPAAVIVEILNEDGTMARRPDLEAFARTHGLKIGTVAELIQYRMQNEKSVERVGECNLPTEYGEFRLVSYLDVVDQQMHLALVYGEVDPAAPTLVRVHLRDTLTDVLGGRRQDAHRPFAESLRRIAAAGSGVAVLLQYPEPPQAMIKRIRNYALADRGVNLPSPEDDGNLRVIGIGSQILADLGVHKMRVLGTQRKMPGLSGFGLEVVEYVS